MEIGARERKELYIPPSQSMSVPKTSKEHALKWVRGVVEGMWVIVAGCDVEVVCGMKEGIDSSVLDLLCC